MQRRKLKRVLALDYFLRVSNRRYDVGSWSSYWEACVRRRKLLLYISSLVSVKVLLRSWSEEHSSNFVVARRFKRL